jgi:hypothetical protein
MEGDELLGRGMGDDGIGRQYCKSLSSVKHPLRMGNASHWQIRITRVVWPCSCVRGAFIWAWPAYDVTASHGQLIVPFGKVAPHPISVTSQLAVCSN